jgi:hypothetical protein
MTGASLAAEGTLRADWKGGVAVPSLVLALNGGTVRADGRLDLREAALSPRSQASLEVTRVGLSKELSPLLERLHPILHSPRGRLEGRLDGSLALTWEGELSPDLESAGRSLRGRGRFAAAELAVADSRLADGISRALGRSGPLAGELRIGALELAEGRVQYRDTVLSSSGRDIRFLGSVGFDRTLDLSVELPLAQGLLRGRSVRVPLRGTLERPRLDLTRAVNGILGRTKP